ncbi:MAG: hypothetical protein AMS17_06900 [Spirochaetes bacterium DG_61]|nr:MAG: hypothetical protein AMS17_06900 [Spirochaetes bacterium DG_61]
MIHFFSIKKRRHPVPIHYWARALTFYYPFTVPGTALALLSLALLIRGFRTASFYGVMLAGIAIAVLLVLSLAGRLQVSRFRDAPFQWDSSTPLSGGETQNTQHFHSGNLMTLWFYRIHFRISGKMAVGRDAFLYISQEASSPGGDCMSIPLHFPFSGEFQAQGVLTIRDIFGLSRARFGEDMTRTMIVQPGPFADVNSHHIEAIGGLEDRSRQSALEEERYYMREYIPGDRFRDINWKSSSRLSQLITRISPHTQEKKKLVCVDFRHYKSTPCETIYTIALLDQLKSWLLRFLRRMKQDNPDYEFLIHTGTGSFRLNKEEDIDEFGFQLSSLFFQAEPPGYQGFIDAQEIFIFTTCYDDRLSEALARYGKAAVHVFRTVKGGAGGIKGRKIQFFPFMRSIPIPGIWIFTKERSGGSRETGLASGQIEDYPVEVKLFGS